MSARAGTAAVPPAGVPPSVPGTAGCSHPWTGHGNDEILIILCAYSQVLINSGSRSVNYPLAVPLSHLMFTCH